MSSRKLPQAHYLKMTYFEKTNEKKHSVNFVETIWSIGISESNSYQIEIFATKTVWRLKIS